MATHSNKRTDNVFKLKIESLECRGAHDASDCTLAEAMQTVFALSDRVLLQWNDISIPLGFKYDISMMIDDVIRMLLAMAAAEAGYLRVEWPSSGFPYEWQVSWSSSEVQISASARDEPGAEKLARHHVSVEMGHFLLVWRNLLAHVLECLEASGYTAGQIKDLARLRLVART